MRNSKMRLNELRDNPNARKNKFKDIGYKVDMKLLKASDFGVPQNRERVIFIGVRNDIDKEITYPEETHNADGSDGKKKHKTVKFLFKIFYIN